MTQTCAERFHRFTKIARGCAKIVGADVIAPDYKVSLLTCLVILAINIYYACTIYTIYDGLVVKGDWKILLQSLSLAGSAVQGYSKLLSCIYRRIVMTEINNYLHSVYKDYQQKDVAFEKVLNDCSDLTSKFLKSLLTVYIFTVCTIVFYPLIYWLHSGEKKFIMQFLIPGIDPLTEIGFITHIGCQICLMFMGGFGNFAGDLYIFIFIINIPLLRDILQIKFEKLNEVVLKTHDPRITMALLKDILEWHQNYNNICCTLFSMLIGSWPAAFSYLLYSFTMLYAYCSLGHLVEVSNDGVITTIYTDCLWYELSLPEQKLVLLMLRKSQKPMTLTIGQIMPLSMSSALQLTKCIYSYMMMLLNFLNEEEN